MKETLTALKNEQTSHELVQLKTFVIAEMACSHEGDVGLAKKIIDASAVAKADAVQLQIWSLQYMMSPQRKEYGLLQKIEFTQQQWRELVTYSRNKYPNMQVYVCVYEHSTIEFIDSLGIDGYKLNSSDLSNPLVLDKVAATGRHINLSVGASTIAEIHSAVKRISSISEAPITLMYGHQSFPTHPENVNMAYMQKLAHLFDLPIGYQDHCDADDDSAFWLPAASMGMGVSVLEKHITHDRSLKGIDHESALNPDEFIKFVKMVRTIDQAKGINTPREFSADEIKYREFQKKSVVVAKDMKVGSILKESDLSFMRAERLGIPPNKIDTVLGRELKNDISAYQPLTKDSFR
jgi:N,N'-diacetyllegionaminate synthase